MPDKDINIHVRAQDTEKTKQDIESVSTSMYDFYKAVGQASQQSEEQSKKSASGFLSMGSILNNLKSQVAGFVLGWLSLQGVMKILDVFNQKLENMLRLSKEFYDKTIQLQQAGQSLSFQTGAGTAKEMGLKLLDVQKAGGLADVGLSKTVIEQAVAVYGKDKGMPFAKQIAPLVGAAQMDSSQIHALFQIAEQAKIPADIKSFQSLITKILAGAAAGKQTFGEFTEGLSGPGITNFLAMGGSLDKAISLYSAAGNVSANKRAGNSLLDLVAQISAGQNEKAARALNAFSGGEFNKADMDARADIVLKYINSLPEATRVKTLTDKGFPSAADLSKLANPQAQQIIAETQKTVADANAQNIEPTIRAYKESAVAKDAAVKTEVAKLQSNQTPAELDWQRRLETAKGEFEVLQQKGQDRLGITDKIEPAVMAYEQMITEVKQLMESAPAGSEQQNQARDLYYQMLFETQHVGPVNQFLPFIRRRLHKEGAGYAGRLSQLESAEPNQPQQINITNNYGDTYQPQVGETDQNRFDPNAM